MDATYEAGINGGAALNVMEISTGADIATYVMNGAATLLLAFIGWLAKRAFDMLKSAHEKLEHIDECMDGVKKASELDRAAMLIHRSETESLEKEIALLKREYAGLEGWAKGRFGLSIDAEITQVPPHDNRS